MLTTTDTLTTALVKANANRWRANKSQRSQTAIALRDLGRPDARPEEITEAELAAVVEQWRLGGALGTDDQ